MYNIAYKLIFYSMLFVIIIYLYQVDHNLRPSNLILRYDAGHYLELIKNEVTFASSPNPQTFGFLALAKLEHSLLGTDTTFYVVRFFFLVIFFSLFARWYHFLAVLHFLPYIFMYSKEAYLIFILVIFYNRSIISLNLLILIRPTIAPIILINIIKKWFNSLLILFLTTILLISEHSLSIGYLYQVLNTEEYGRKCFYAISFCYSNNYFYDIFIAFLRIIALLPVYLVKSITDIFYVFYLVNPIDVAVNIAQVFTSLISIMLLVKLALQKRLIRFFKNDHIEITVFIMLVAVTMFVSGERIFDVIKSLFIIAFFGANFIQGRKERISR